MRARRASEGVWFRIQGSRIASLPSPVSREDPRQQAEDGTDDPLRSCIAEDLIDDGDVLAL